MRKDIILVGLILAVAIIICAWMLNGQEMAEAAGADRGEYEIVAIGENPVILFRLNEITGEIDAFRINTIDLQDLSQSTK